MNLQEVVRHSHLFFFSNRELNVTACIYWAGGEQYQSGCCIRLFCRRRVIQTSGIFGYMDFKVSAFCYAVCFEVSVRSPAFPLP